MNPENLNKVLAPEKKETELKSDIVQDGKGEAMIDEEKVLENLSSRKQQKNKKEDSPHKMTNKEYYEQRDRENRIAKKQRKEKRKLARTIRKKEKKERKDKKKAKKKALKKAKKDKKAKIKSEKI